MRSRTNHSSPAPIIASNVGPPRCPARASNRAKRQANLATTITTGYVLHLVCSHAYQRRPQFITFAALPNARAAFDRHYDE